MRVVFVPAPPAPVDYNGAVRKGVVLLLLLGVVSAQGGLGGKITGGKPKKLVDKGLPLINKADEIWKAWILDEITDDRLKAQLKEAVKLYDEGTALLQQAVEIQNDPGVNHRLNIAARRLQKMRFYISFRLEKPARKRPPPASPENPKPRPEPEPDKPVRPPPRPKDLEIDDEQPAARAAIPAGAPPALPVSADLPEYLDGALTPEQEVLFKRDEKTIEKRLKDYFQAFRAGKMLARHRLCRGKGLFGNDAPCEECHGTGKQINLHYFRKAFWTSFSPSLRDSEEALGALALFYDRAQKDVSALGPVVSSFKIAAIHYQGVWAKAQVSANTSAGKKDYEITLISIGSSWFFYHPETDRGLLPPEELE